MLFLIVGGVLLAAVVAGYMYWRVGLYLVPEDSVAVTIDQHGFFSRLLPAGRQRLHPFERVELILSTRTQLASGQTADVTTRDAAGVVIHWSGPFRLQPAHITEAHSQRLRSLPNAERIITRQVDILLRRLVGQIPLRGLFLPSTRRRLEHQLNLLLAENLRPLGIDWLGISLQTIDLPREIVQALNKARAIETLDEAIRRLDPTTRQIVQGAYRLDELIHWDSYLPGLSRLAMRQAAISQ